MKKFALIVAVATLSAAPFAAVADEFGLDLKYIDANSHHGQRKIANWIDEHAFEVCGPVDMPQPIDLLKYRRECQADFRSMAWSAVNRAIARNDARLTVDEIGAG
jgi:UrcA family protein